MKSRLAEMVTLEMCSCGVAPIYPPDEVCGHCVNLDKRRRQIHVTKRVLQKVKREAGRVRRSKNI